MLDVSQSAVLWAVPITASDMELTAKFCEVFAHYSKEYVIPAFYETTLQEKFSRDADTKEMLEKNRCCFKRFDCIICAYIRRLGCLYDEYAHRKRSTA